LKTEKTICFFEKPKKPDNEVDNDVENDVYVYVYVGVVCIAKSERFFGKANGFSKTQQNPM